MAVGKTTLQKYASLKGLEIEDAKKPIVLTVQKRDINRAVEKNHDACAFAMASCRQLGAEKAFFFRSVAYIEKSGKLVRYRTNPAITLEIEFFDRDKNMRPGEYVLNPPAPSQRLDYVHSKKRRTPHRRDVGGDRAPIRHVFSNVRRRFVEQEIVEEVLERVEVAANG
jgi:hypothetical protein